MGIVGTFLIAVAVMAIVFYLKLRIDHKMLNTGKMINRQKNFMESAEEFTLQTVDPEQVTMAVSQIHYWEMGVTKKQNSEQQVFVFTNSDWTAQLYRLSGDESQVTYRFEFTKWRDALSNASLMNMLMTAIEKLFLELDPNTQVRTVPLDVKTKHSFL